MKITKVHAIEILDSRGNPTVKAYVELENGIVGTAAVPSGASTGTHEAAELRDNDTARYLGKGVQTAVNNVNTTINDLLVGADCTDLVNIDKKMLEADGTENKTKLGANAILSVSLAAARALAITENKPLWKTIHDVYFPNTTVGFPRLMANIINGGKHADWNFDIQEFMVAPQSTKPSESVRAASEIFHTLGSLLKKSGFSTLVGDEGGYSPLLSSNDEVFTYIRQSIEQLGATGVDITVDAASSEFYDKTKMKYILKKQGKELTGNELGDYYAELKQKYGIISFEDPFAEDDWDSFKAFTAKVGSGTLVVGDDLFVTNPKRLQKGIDEKSANALLVKVNQIGTLSETVQAINMCRQNNFKVIISHRSGETEDAFIADLAVACGADFIKTGSMCRSDRVAKYNRLLEIEKLEFNNG